MIKVTVWNENVQENGLKFMPKELVESTDPRAMGFKAFLEGNVENIRKIHPDGIHMTIKGILERIYQPKSKANQTHAKFTERNVKWAHIKTNMILLKSKWTFSQFLMNLVRGNLK